MPEKATPGEKKIVRGRRCEVVFTNGEGPFAGWSDEEMCCLNICIYREIERLKHRKEFNQFGEKLASDPFDPHCASTDDLIAECDSLDLFGQIGRATEGWNVWRLGIPEAYAFGVTLREALIDLYEKSKNSKLSPREAAEEAKKS